VGGYAAALGQDITCAWLSDLEAVSDAFLEGCVLGYTNKEQYLNKLAKDYGSK